MIFNDDGIDRNKLTPSAENVNLCFNKLFKINVLSVVEKAFLHNQIIRST